MQRKSGKGDSGLKQPPLDCGDLDALRSQDGKANQLAHPLSWLIEASLGRDESLESHRRFGIAIFSSFPFLYKLGSVFMLAWAQDQGISEKCRGSRERERECV